MMPALAMTLDAVLQTILAPAAGTGEPAGGDSFAAVLADAGGMITDSKALPPKLDLPVALPAPPVPVAICVEPPVAVIATREIRDAEALPDDSADTGIDADAEAEPAGPAPADTVVIVATAPPAPPPLPAVTRVVMPEAAAAAPALASQRTEPAGLAAPAPPMRDRQPLPQTVAAGRSTPARVERQPVIAAAVRPLLPAAVDAPMPVAPTGAQPASATVPMPTLPAVPDAGPAALPVPAAAAPSPAAAPTPPATTPGARLPVPAANPGLAIKPPRTVSASQRVATAAEPIVLPQAQVSTAPAAEAEPVATPPERRLAPPDPIAPVTARILDTGDGNLDLSTERLGAVSVALEARETRVGVHFAVDTLVAATMLSGGAGRLADAVGASGARLEGLSVDVRGGGGSGGGGQPPRGDPPRPPAQMRPAQRAAGRFA